MRDWLMVCDCDWLVKLPSVVWESMAEVSMFGLTSNSTLPNWRLSEPSDQQTTSLFDCFYWEKVHNPNR